jgi:hypothetical protein
LIEEEQRRQARLHIASEVKVVELSPALRDQGLHGKQRSAALMGEAAIVASNAVA